MPIGNLTSQIFANIYLNELDRFVVHKLRPKHYLRYGDDFILVHPDMERLELMRTQTLWCLRKVLKLNLNSQNDKIIKASHGLRFLGVVIKPEGRNLKRRNSRRIQRRLSLRNANSYYGLVNKHQNQKSINEFAWRVYLLLNSGD